MSPATHLKHIVLVWAALLVISSVQFLIFPGHSPGYSRSGAARGAEIQVYAPMLERLAQPGLLTRDLVATHPDLTYTAFDEVTLSLEKAFRLDLDRSLDLQQFTFRLAGVLGLFLLARAAGLSLTLSLLVALLTSLGGFVPGPDLFANSRDPSPFAFALSAVLASAGFLATARPLCAGVAAGVALLYDWRLAAPFWLLVLVAMLWSAPVRRMMRATLPIFAVFVLLLANLAQLQPGVADAQTMSGKIPAALFQILQFRTPQVWIGFWSTNALFWPWCALAAYAWGLARIWPRLQLPARWVFAGVPIIAFSTFLVLLVLPHRLPWYVLPRVQPSVLLVLLFFFCVVACAMAGICRWHAGHRVEAGGLLLLVALFGLLQPRAASVRDVTSVSQWALNNTWGGSMFLFPDIDKGEEPAAFRAESKRAVWVDWATGILALKSDSFADEWHRRWQDTMGMPYATDRLVPFLSLPIDYFVLQTPHALSGVHPVFADKQFVVYDANDLRSGALKKR